MDYRALFTSKEWLGVADLGGREHTVTIESVTKEAIQGDDGPEPRWVARFRGAAKRLPLNKTNADALFAIANTEHVEAWAGLTVVLFVVPTTYKGKATEGIRIRAAHSAPAPAAPVQSGFLPTAPASAAPLGSPVDDSDIPF